jgi:hypothetical protein
LRRGPKGNKWWRGQSSPRGGKTDGGADGSLTAGVDHWSPRRGHAEREIVQRGEGGDGGARPFLKWRDSLGQWWGPASRNGKGAGGGGLAGARTGQVREGSR